MATCVRCNVPPKSSLLEWLLFVLVAARRVAVCSGWSLEADDLSSKPRGGMSWKEAQSQAKVTLSRMRPDEKLNLLHGSHGTYVGNTPSVERLGIPRLSMQDASQGFRPVGDRMTGTVTCWPSLLSLAAIWSPKAVREYAEAIGREFKSKGANVLLGPGLNVHRIARGGRNFEYLSGEDPYLGAALAGPYIRGVQDQGVIAVMKHWIFNEQETRRGHEDVRVDDRTAWELYYPPFQAAIDAGVGAAMCSYNKVNSVYSCGNPKQLAVLKNLMGFQGFVQSDWGATHSSNSLEAGLDQEMPFGQFFKSENIEDVSSHIIDDAVTRILAALYRVNITQEAGSGYHKNVTSSSNTALARKIAAQSVVLLKNELELLPLSPAPIQNRFETASIAIIGAAATAQPFDPQVDFSKWAQGDYYSGGGSGHIAAGVVVTPLEGIRNRAESLGIKVVESSSRDRDRAIKAARMVDVAIVVAAALSGESVDRENLQLDSDVDGLIEQVAEHAKRTIVIMQIPGAVVMPWRHSVNAILAMFYGGQETGHAWADVLFDGGRSPEGRLPITMPATEVDAIPPSVGDTPTAVYTEGLRTGYRNPDFEVAFPFGHGLSFTSFRYSNAKTVLCPWMKCLAVTVTNSGKRNGTTVAQLYVEFPPKADYPTPLLKGFARTGVLVPGESEEVLFRLTERDLSYYHNSSLSFMRAERFVAHVGESSRDIRQRLKFSIGAEEPVMLPSVMRIDKVIPKVKPKEAKVAATAGAVWLAAAGFGAACVGGVLAVVLCISKRPRAAGSASTPSHQPLPSADTAERKMRRSIEPPAKTPSP